jgi:hypothetical protein
MYVNAAAYGEFIVIREESEGYESTFCQILLYSLLNFIQCMS